VNRFLVLIAAVAAVALVAAGCGGDDSTTDSTASLTKAEFLKQGNAICAAGNKTLDRGFEQFAKENKDSNLSKNKKPSEAELEEISEAVLIPGISKQVEELRGLGAPEGDEGEVDELLSNAEEALEEVEEDPSALSEENGAFAEVNKEAREYGLTVCGEES